MTLALATGSLASGAAAAAGQRIVVVSSSDEPPYELALAGIQRQDAPVELHRVTGDNAASLPALLARTGRSVAIVTLGDKAADIARAASVAHVVSCMVIGDDAKPSDHAATVPLQVPIDLQVLWLKRLLPAARNVGILFDPAQNQRRAAESAAALKRAGYVPLLEPVSGPAALPAALARLHDRADVLHALKDTTVFARGHSRALILFSFRNRAPLVGPSEEWVRAGALFAVDWDYSDLGRHCAVLALRAASGNRTPPPPPAKTRVIANLRSAEQLRIQWSADVVHLFDRVYE